MRRRANMRGVVGEPGPRKPRTTSSRGGGRLRRPGAIEDVAAATSGSSVRENGSSFSDIPHPPTLGVRTFPLARANPVASDRQHEYATVTDFPVRASIIALMKSRPRSNRYHHFHFHLRQQIRCSLATIDRGVALCCRARDLRAVMPGIWSFSRRRLRPSCNRLDQLHGRPSSTRCSFPVSSTCDRATASRPPARWNTSIARRLQSRSDRSTSHPDPDCGAARGTAGQAVSATISTMV